MASIGEADSAGFNDEPIRLYTPMNMPENTTLAFTSPYKIVVDGLQIWSSTPIYITTGDFETFIESGEKWDTEFGGLWNKLPDELKIKILAFNLEYDHPVDSLYGSAKHMESQNGVLLSYLRMTPEIATLATEIFYSHNLFSLRTSPSSVKDATYLNPGAYLAYPSPTVNQHVRRVRIRIGTEPADWNHLRRLANGEYGFENLKSIAVEVQLSYQCGIWSQFHSRFMDQVKSHSVHFNCGGQTTVMTEGPRQSLSAEQILWIKTSIKKLVTFKDGLVQEAMEN